MRALTFVVLIAACARGGPAFKLAVTDAYEVGEDVTVAVHVREPTETENGEIVVTRPDGTTVKRRVAFDVELSRIKLGPPAPRPGIDPTITVVGTYKLELRSDDRVLATQELEVTDAKLDELIPAEDIAGYKPVARFTRPKQSGTKRWKTYGAIYEDPSHANAQVEVLVEKPGRHLDEAWRTYEEEPRSVILGKTVRLRERTESVTASWIATNKTIIVMSAPTLADLEQGLIAHFLERYPSTL